MKKITESDSNYAHLDKMSIKQLLSNINKEDQLVPLAVKKVIPQLEKFIAIVVDKMRIGGRLFYMGAGTSGRLGIVDASECPPTFGVSHDLVIGLIAGGDKAIRKAVEFAEDDIQQGWKDLQKYKINKKDVVIGIAASGTTPYVIGALKECNKNKIITGCITCNKNSPLAAVAQHAVEVIVGPEFVTGSTRMKSGTAQKLVLNMISTSVMIRLGKVKGNKMVDMTPTNNKLIQRGVDMIMNQARVNEKKAKELLMKHKTVRKAVQSVLKNK